MLPSLVTVVSPSPLPLFLAPFYLFIYLNNFGSSASSLRVQPSLSNNIHLPGCGQPVFLEEGEVSHGDSTGRELAG
jgi:hypothetical protein